jgi:O-antigen/teichoic acid export membrane protein
MGSENSSKKDYIKFTGDVGWVSLYRVAVYLLAFFTIPALTKNLGTELYGLWNQILVTVGFLTPILMLHLGTAVVRYLASEERKDVLSQSFANILCIIITLSLSALILSIIFRTNLSLILFDSANYGTFVILTFVYAAASSLFDFILTYLRARGKIKQLSIINVVSYTLMTASLIILATLGFSLEFMTCVYLLIYFIFVVIMIISVKRDTGLRRPKFDKTNVKSLKKFILFSVPQIPNGILLWVLNLSDRFLGLSQAGIYSASYNIGSIITAFYMPISFVLFPVVSRYWDNNEKGKVRLYLEYSTKIFLFIAIPGSIGLYVLSKPLLQILTTSEFVIGGALTFYVAVGYIFLGIFQINSFIISLVEKTKFIPIITAIGGTMNILLNIILIPLIGIIGAAIATLISYLILSVIVLLWARKEVKYKLDTVFLVKVILSSMIMALIIQYILSASIHRIIIAVLVGIAVYLSSTFVLKTLHKEEKEIIYDILGTLKNLVGRKIGTKK